MNMCSWGLCCASDSELAAVVVERSAAVRVTSPEDLQLVSTRRVLHRLLKICKAYDVVVNIWVSIETREPLVCADTRCVLVTDSVGSGALAMSSGTSACLVSTAAVGQRFVDSEGACSVGTNGRDGASWINLQAPDASSALNGFSSGCRDPAKVWRASGLSPRSN